MSNWLRLPFGYGSAGECYLVPGAEGDALLALLAEAEEWRQRQPSPMPSLHPDAWLASAVVAAHRAVNPPPPAPPPASEPTCADCGTTIPADQTPVPCDAGVTCYGCAEARHRRQRDKRERAARVRAAIEAHKGQRVECQLTPRDPWVAAAYVTARSTAFAATVTAIRWTWKCACPDCDAGHWQYQVFEEETP